MAHNTLNCINNSTKIFQVLGTSYFDYQCVDSTEDVEDRKFIEAFTTHSPEVKPFLASYFSDFPNITDNVYGSPTSDDSGVCLSSDSVKLERDYDCGWCFSSDSVKLERDDDSGVCLSPDSVTLERDDDSLSLILDDQDIEMVRDFINEKQEVYGESLQEYSLTETQTDGLNLPLLPKLGLDCNENIATIGSSGSCGEYDDDTDVVNDESDSDYKPPNRKGCKSILLWKFLLSTLAGDANDGMILWEDKYKGIFRFVDTVRISQRWGHQKKKSDMNFEKLSRGIRHYYSSGLMSRVGGKRLVYQFNWKKVPKCYRQTR